MTRQQLRAQVRADAFVRVNAAFGIEPRRARRKIARAWAKQAWGKRAALFTASCGILALTSLGLITPAARAQSSRKDDVVFNAQGRPMAGATVRVCTSAATGQPCSPLANIYSDTALTQALANPLATDGLGNYFFYAAPGRYMIEISGPGITTKQIPNVILPNDPSSPTFSSVTTTSSISAFSLSLSGNLTVNGSAAVTSTLTVGGAPVPSTTQANTWTASQTFKGPSPWLDVLAYGAKGDSATDDTAAINAAITAWAAVDSGTLYFPPPTGNQGGNGGCYVVNGEVDWPTTFTHWRNVEMNGNFCFTGNGLFKFNFGAGGQAHSIRFHGQSGGNTSAFTIGPYSYWYTTSSTRTIPLIDIRGTNFLVFDGIRFDNNSAMATESILSGQDPVSGNGAVQNQFIHGGAACYFSNNCVPFRQTVTGPTGQQFGLSFDQFSFTPPAVGDYSVILQNTGSISFHDCFWGSHGILLQSTNAGTPSGSLTIDGALSLTENMTGPFLTLDVSGGHIDGITIGPWLGMADNIGTQYLTKTINQSTYTVRDLVIIQSSSGSGFWDLTSGGSCPEGTTVIGGTDQFDYTTGGCAITYMKNDAIVASAPTSSPRRAPLLVPTGILGIGVGTSSVCPLCGGTPNIVSRLGAGAGMGVASYPAGGTKINGLFDSDGDNGLGFGVPNGNVTSLYSYTPNTSYHSIFFDHGNARVDIFANGKYSHFNEDGTVNFPGNVQFVNSGHNQIFTASSLSADRTATFPNNSGTVAELNLAQTWTASQTFGGVATALSTKSAPYTLTTSDAWVNVTGTTTVTVPHATVGQRWVVFNSGSNTVTVQDDSGNINGGANITLAANTGKEITCDGSNCFAH